MSRTIRKVKSGRVGRITGLVVFATVISVIGILVSNGPKKQHKQSPYEIGWTMGHTSAGVEAGTIPKDRLGAFREWWLTQSNASKEFTSNVNAGYKAGYREGKHK